MPLGLVFTWAVRTEDTAWPAEADVKLVAEALQSFTFNGGWSAPKATPGAALSICSPETV